ncbi:MAG: porin family protein [Tannerellaceae bacterium]|jgi:sRNA-binding regulator protein Hfq|nr:porin family protein [Tannerellaceae bacterium]
MKKVLFYLVLLIMTVPRSFAQSEGEVTVYLRNGSIVIGELTELNNERLSVETPNGSIIYFTDKAIKEIVEENARSSRLRRTLKNEVTVYLHNGSILIGQLTEQDDEGRMKVETPNRSVIYFTEKSVKELVEGNDLRQDEIPSLTAKSGRGVTTGSRSARNTTTGRSTEDNATPARSQTSRSAISRNQTTGSQTTRNQTSRNTGTRYVAPQQELIPQVPDYKISGYGGMFEAGYTIGMGDISTSRLTFSTSHGYQINPYFFVGVGAGVNLYSDGLYYRGGVPKDTILVSGTVKKDTLNIPVTIPVFVDLRVNFIEGASIIPFAGLKAGYTMGISIRDYADDQKKRHETKMEGVGFYLEPSVGVKFTLLSSFAVNLSAGYSVQSFTHPYKLNNKQYEKVKNNGGPSIKIGIEF